MFDFDKTEFSAKERVVIYFKEYDTLRAEIVSRSSSYLQVFTIASAIGGAVIAVTLKDAASATDLNRILAVIAFLVVLTIIAVAVAVGMFSNTKKLGLHVADLERQINELAGTRLSHEAKMDTGR